MKFCTLFFVALLGVQLSGCAGEDDSQSDLSRPKFDILFNASTMESGGGSTKQQNVVTNQTEFERQLSSYTSEPAPTVDFNENRVLFLNMGSQTSGGYTITIDSVVPDKSGDAVVVNAVYHSPGPKCFVTLALTDPYLVLRVVTTKDITVNEIYKTTRCE